MIIRQKVYWGLDENEKVIIDTESIKRSFDRKLENIVHKHNGGTEGEMDAKRDIQTKED